jgi:hypothetical protein
MKHLKKFNEAIIDWKSDNLEKFIKEVEAEWSIGVDELQRIGAKNDIEVVYYRTFYDELPTDKMRKDAPPNGMKVFGLLNPVTKKPRLVLANNVRYLESNDISFAIHVLKHENIHLKQGLRRPADLNFEFLGNISDQKAYFSNKDEVMAFSQSITDLIMERNPNDIKDAFSKLKSIGLWVGISRAVSDDIKKRYKKYIYLYLEKEFEEINGK